MINHAQPTPSSAAAHAPASRPLELLEARRLRDLIASLLRKEQLAMADFLIALADFDRRRGWEPLGHAHLFAFLVVELRLSKGAAFYRKSAAELLQDFPEVIEPLREGRLCLSTIAELAKVLTEENREVVVPRFFGLSAREAQVLVAELQPRPEPPLRDLMISETRVVGSTELTDPAPCLRLEFPLPAVSPLAASLPAATETRPRDMDSAPSREPQAILTSEFPPAQPMRNASRPDEIEPLTASLTRLHFTVRREVVKKVETARRGLGHAIPNATLEQVLEAGLDLLLEKQAKARGQMKKPRAVRATPMATVTATGMVTGTPTEVSKSPVTPTGAATVATTPSATAAPTEPPLHRRDGTRKAIPAAVKRAVWARDAGRCSWPVDGGGVCGSTHRLELDHIVPWARWGGETEGNLRLVCAAHNRLASRRAFGERVMERYLRGGARSAG
jgi:hypothetical protein